MGAINRVASRREHVGALEQRVHLTHNARNGRIVHIDRIRAGLYVRIERCEETPALDAFACGRFTSTC